MLLGFGNIRKSEENSSNRAPISQNSSISSYLSNFEHIASRSALDFGSAFTTIAVVEGSSDRIHIDANDHGVTWILPLGDWTGATLVIPQLKLELELHSGQLLGFSANLLAHYCTPITSGRRVVITMFTCHNIFSDAMMYSHLRSY